MSFTLRQISTTADGRQIVRATTVEKNEIIIGRDSASDIHLADLAVDVRHAKITRLSSGMIFVEAIGSLGFDADGRHRSEFDFDPKAGSELRFGSHRLTIGDDQGQVVITVERTGNVSESADEKDVTGLFTLKGLLPGRRASAWSLIALVLAVFLAWPIYTYATSRGVKERPAGFHADRLWTSGALSQAHKSLEGNCQACHVNKFEAVTDQTCLACHKEDAHDHADPARIARAMEAPGLGGTIKAKFKTSFGMPPGGCVECHTEHEGAGKMTPTAQQFCTDCHASLNTRLTDTKLPNAGDFGTQHPQFRPALTVGMNGDQRLTKRVTLTAGLTEDNGLKFTHAQHLSKTNGIARMTQTLRAQQGWGDSLACKDCHTPTADGTRFLPVEMEKNCQMCHSLAFENIGGTLRTLRHGEPAQVVADLRAFYRSTLPSRPINLSGMARRRPGDYSAVETATVYSIGARAWPGQASEAIRAVFSRGGACYDCHVVSQTGAGYAIKKVFQPARYMNNGWFDHDAHKTETCGSCHNAAQSKGANDLLLPDLASCRTCHVGEGGAHLATVKTPVESSCALCHDYHMDSGAPWTVKLQAAQGGGRSKSALQRGAAR
jgi:hypothetical protein